MVLLSFSHLLHGLPQTGIAEITVETEVTQEVTYESTTDQSQTVSITSDNNPGGEFDISRFSPNDPTISPLKNCPTPRPGSRVVGYYVLPDNPQPVSERQFESYTDIILSSITPLPDFTFNFGRSKTTWVTLAKDFVARSEKRCVTPLLGLGGWDGSRYFSGLVYTPEKREKFASSIISLMKEVGFRGVDLSWLCEPGVECNEISPEDLTNWADFLTLMRSKIPSTWVSISGYIAGLSGPPQKDEKTRIAYQKIVKAVSYVILMTYDVYGSWSETTGPVSPLSDKCNDEGNKFSFQESVKIYIALSFNPLQIIPSVPSTSHGWRLVKGDLKDKKFPNGLISYIYQNHTKEKLPGGPSDTKPGGLDQCGKPTNYTGTWTVQELVQTKKLTNDLTRGDGGYQRIFDTCSGTPFILNKQERILISYDDVESTILKTQFVASMGLGGIGL
ncbi:hypothetical protein CROQUDRAFT_39857 [Cronartium quercuum f. sp. fusiforme G11]|uniref:GH18 domain-containing protein n=1 Tax=Cronartium quercuum f. sp. fusiforme G11 TaxID=708437 RepID=A0A9P6TF44_9BASI|nr:hypothetical protein CROQUDRAFT_39857 [Cronartium quercuum f. sp. fusiforme G11]